MKDIVNYILEKQNFLIKGHTKKQKPYIDICGIKVEPLTNIKNKNDFDKFIDNLDHGGDFEWYKSNGYIYTCLEKNWSNTPLSKEDIDILEKFIKEFCSDKEQVPYQPLINYYFIVQNMLEKCNDNYSILAGLIYKIWINILKY